MTEVVTIAVLGEVNQTTEFRDRDREVSHNLEFNPFLPPHPDDVVEAVEDAVEVATEASDDVVEEVAAEAETTVDVEETDTVEAETTAEETIEDAAEEATDDTEEEVAAKSGAPKTTASRSRKKK